MGIIISKKLQCIFIHIPKTGGTSIAEPKHHIVRKGCLVKYLGHDDLISGGHKRAFDLYNTDKTIKEVWNLYFKFCFVRNPWDRLVSAYSYYIQDVKKRFSPLGKLIGQYKDFTSFCFDLNNLDLDEHFIPQADFITNENGSIIMDFVGRFERLSKDFAIICDTLSLPQIALPHYRKTNRTPYHHYYNKNTKDIVAKLYIKDIDLFGYSFN